MAVAAHAWLPINVSFEKEAGTLDRSPSSSSDVAESYLASIISETLMIIKILFIEREI